MQVQQLFSSIFDNECWRDNIKMALVLVFLVLSVVVIVVLTLLIVALAENHLMIFGCLTISEVQFEVWKRYVFLEVFF